MPCPRCLASASSATRRRSPRVADAVKHQPLPRLASTAPALPLRNLRSPSLIYREPVNRRAPALSAHSVPSQPTTTLHSLQRPDERSLLGRPSPKTTFSLSGSLSSRGRREFHRSTRLLRPTSYIAKPPSAQHNSEPLVLKPQDARISGHSTPRAYASIKDNRDQVEPPPTCPI
ncbi:hypothetical protein OF83DRAFT_48221 [Amylostereum chailletii]|nr:hypothetical protein OF83DRAFT_48221 [Amylostereum chailletii]